MAGTPRTRRSWLGFAWRVGLSVLLGLVVVEMAVRVATGTLWSSGSGDGRRYSDRDPVVGVVPKPGVSIRHPKGFTINIGEYGTRSNGATPARSARPLTLVVGDSFAFSDEVDDADTWAAKLERQAGGRVVNAGVPGFGLDQAVLRAEQLAPRYAPDTIIVSFIPHDVIRCAMSFWSGNAKPYFEIDASGLRLHPPPAPQRSMWTPLKLALADSVTLDLLCGRWLHWDGPDTVVHDRSREVACYLMERLAALARRTGARIVVLAQPQQPVASDEHLQIKDHVLACAARNGLPTVDLFPVIYGIPDAERATLFHGHMTAAGNEVVARRLVDALAGVGSPAAAADAAARAADSSAPITPRAEHAAQ